MLLRSRTHTASESNTCCFGVEHMLAIVSVWSKHSQAQKHSLLNHVFVAFKEVLHTRTHTHIHTHTHSKETLPVAPNKGK